MSKREQAIKQTEKNLSSISTQILQLQQEQKQIQRKQDVLVYLPEEQGNRYLEVEQQISELQRQIKSTGRQMLRVEEQKEASLRHEQYEIDSEKQEWRWLRVMNPEQQARFDSAKSKIDDKYNASMFGIRQALEPLQKQLKALKKEKTSLEELGVQAGQDARKRQSYDALMMSRSSL